MSRRVRLTGGLMAATVVTTPLIAVVLASPAEGAADRAPTATVGTQGGHQTWTKHQEHAGATERAGGTSPAGAARPD